MQNYRHVRIEYFVRGCLLFLFLSAFTGSGRAAPTEIVEEAPASITRLGPDSLLVDFGRVTFGNLKLSPPMGAAGSVVVHFGEALANGRINRMPPGTVRYAKVDVTLSPGASLVVAPAPDKRNTTPPAVLTPAEWGTLTPFRWVEIEGWPGGLTAGQITRRSVYAKGWPADAASFHSTDATLDRIWALGRDSIGTGLLIGLAPFGILCRERLLGMTLRQTAFNILFLGVLMAALLIGTGPRRRFALLKPLRFLGEVSYGVYLIHTLIFWVVDRCFGMAFPHMPTLTTDFRLLCARFFVAISVTIAVCYLLRWHFEERFLRLKEKFGS